MNVFSLSWAAAGLALLGLSLFPAGSLALGGAPAHLAVFLLLLALAALALRLLRREGLDRPRLLDALLPIGLAFFLRALLLDYQSADYQMFLSQWAAAFRDGGGFAAVKLPIGNYNAPYLYFLAAISYLPIPDLYLIKLFSILFDVVLAWGGFRLVRHFAPESPNRPLLCFCLLLLLPTVILNGAFWGQCDALYGALTLHALACALEGRNRSSLLLLGIAFSFKLQTVFVLPLWGGLWLLRRVRFRELLWFPAAYAATCVPALLLGKPLGDILGVYFGQAAEYSGYLNLNAPNMYALIPHGAEVNTALAARLGILAAFALAAAVLAALDELQAEARRAALPAVEVEPFAQESVDFDTFCKSDFRAVKVKACESVKKSAKLLRFILDDGSGTDRQILSGIAMYYKPEELVGKTLVAIINLPPRKMMGQESCGMLLSAVHTEHGEEKLHLVMVDDAIPAGAKLC